MNSERLKHAVEAAQHAFWSSVADTYVEAESGDFPPDADIALREAMSEAVELWVSVNVPNAGVTAAQECIEFFVMIDHEQSAGSYLTLEEARSQGLRMCDAEPIPSVWTIADADGNMIEPINRTDGASLSDQVAAFNKLHLK